MADPYDGKQYSADPTFKVPKDSTSLKRFELSACVVQLRKAGWSFRQIATALKLPEKKTRQIFLRALAKQGKVWAESSRELFFLELERLEEIHRALYPKAMSGDTRAIEQLIRVSERRARLCGWDAPTKIQQQTDITLAALSEPELLLQARELGLHLPTAPPANLPAALPGEEEIPDAVFDPVEQKRNDLPPDPLPPP